MPLQEGGTEMLRRLKLWWHRYWINQHDMCIEGLKEEIWEHRDARDRHIAKVGRGWNA
jgi:hypothetical protein